ncbi:pilus assembly protein [Phyllobacterium salinisoli]|uniref:Pilus assembly protein n=1 Tax=Phyllobacterium salinisoli TaxID=1899321 RepID=A0A368KAQ5_9HYPH|nr:pilus assembly protein [Phyllobacterium salinisoli]
MLARFRRDEGGNFAIMGVFIMAPLLLAGMAAIDAANLMRTRTNVQHALDAASLAVGRQFGGGASKESMQDYGQRYFAANLKVMNPAKVQFSVVLPEDGAPIQQVSAVADFTYNSLFGTLASSLGGGDWNKFRYHMVSDVRVKNTVEVALVLDNSGSMSEKGTGSNEERMVLLKNAATQLVDTMAQQASLMTRIDKPVQFSVVPFAASVNVGPDYEQTANWLDKDGRSSVHYENFDMPGPGSSVTVGANKAVKNTNNVFTKVGSGWGAQVGTSFTRFSIYEDLKIYTNSLNTATRSYTSWKGCVEVRPGVHALMDTKPSAAMPDTLFVPMLAPDEYNATRKYNDRDGYLYTAPINDWWPDAEVNTSSASQRQRDITKYYKPAPYNLSSKLSSSVQGIVPGPDYSCTTTAITALTDVSDAVGLSKIKTAINAMVPNGATNVPEGMAWGWRTISHGEPFTEGRPETERGNDKVVIVLTDGANTYYSLRNWNFRDEAGVISAYSNYGYTGQKTPGYATTRIFQNTSKVSTNLHTNDNYTAAMNEQFAALCDNVKEANIIVMTVALDLDATKGNAAQKKQVQGQIDALKSCSSDSRSRRDEDDPGKPAKLFWNTTGGDLSETFRQIGDELSNLRIVR